MIEAFCVVLIDNAEKEIVVLQFRKLDKYFNDLKLKGFKRFITNLTPKQVIIGITSFEANLYEISKIQNL